MRYGDETREYSASLVTNLQVYCTWICCGELSPLCPPCVSSCGKCSQVFLFYHHSSTSASVEQNRGGLEMRLTYHCPSMYICVKKMPAHCSLRGHLKGILLFAGCSSYWSQTVVPFDYICTYIDYICSLLSSRGQWREETSKATARALKLVLPTCLKRKTIPV